MAAESQRVNGPRERQRSKETTPHESKTSRSERWRRIARSAASWLVTLLGVLIISYGIGRWRGPELPPTAPGVKAKTLEGRVVDLSDLRGQPVVLNFWATWCLPCRLEVPALNRLAERHPDLVVWGIVSPEPREKIAATVAELDIRYPVVLGTPELIKRYGIDTFPTTVIVDRAGAVRSTHVGILWDPQLAWALWDL